MPLKVLVVDDATFVRDLVKRTLRHMIPDLELFEAADGARAMSLIKSKNPDLILSDWEMPEMPGDELLRWLRDQPKFADTPFIMITSRGDRNNVVEAVTAGVSDYLSKPFTAEELTNKIGKQLKRLGYEPPKRGSHVASAPFSSVDILTGNSAASSTSASPRSSRSAINAANTAADNFKGKAYLRFPQITCELQIRELSVQAIGGSIQRPKTIPAVFDQAAVDLIAESGEAMARVNAYVHSVSAATPSPESNRLRVIIRFVDEDPAKLEVLKSLLG